MDGKKEAIQPLFFVLILTYMIRYDIVSYDMISLRDRKERF